MTVYSRKDLSAKEVRELLDYFPDTGEFIWRFRLGNEHSVICWNPKFAGKSAGHFDAKGYKRIKIHATYYAGHRLAWLWMTGEWPPEDVDHINCNKSDNRFNNLRLATRGQNVANTGLKRHNKSGFKGVCYKPRARVYYAQITKNGKVHYLGRFQTPEEAHAVYVRAANQMHGEFARAA
jgi:hypothetical protein